MCLQPRARNRRPTRGPHPGRVLLLACYVTPTRGGRSSGGTAGSPSPSARCSRSDPRGSRTDLTGGAAPSLVGGRCFRDGRIAIKWLVRGNPGSTLRLSPDPPPELV